MSRSQTEPEPRMLFSVSRKACGNLEVVQYEAFNEHDSDRSAAHELGIMLADALRHMCKWQKLNPKEVLQRLGIEVLNPTSPLYETDPETGRAKLRTVPGRGVAR